MMSTLFPVTIEYLSSMRISLGPSNNFPIEIPHRSAGVAAFSHAVLLVSGHARPDNFNSATQAQVTHAQLITAHNRLRASTARARARIPRLPRARYGIRSE